ncbi:MAG: C39 family peptidase [Verrucomicrobiota bacterium]
MKTFCLTFLFMTGLVLPVLSIPQEFFSNGVFTGPVIPSQPSFGADLTGDFLSEANWRSGEFPGPWTESPALEGETIKRMTSSPVLFGAVPLSVTAYYREEQLHEIAINYLNAGAFFGFNPGGERESEERAAGKRKRSEFDDHFDQLERDLRDRLRKGCGRSRDRSVGRSDLLRTTFSDFKWDDFVLRLAAREDHSISLLLTRSADLPETFLDESAEAMKRRDREDELVQQLRHTERGDILLGELPTYQQGNTPFCGVHTLGMAAHYLGLRMHTEGLEASADFKNTGSAAGSKMIDVYRAVAEELRMRVSVTSKFDADRVRRSLEDGMPVIVWRRVTREREDAHTWNASMLAANPSAPLPEVTDELRSSWPRRDYSHPSHASVINGINADRGEVIFTEPWGQSARDRRMHNEEMEASTYAVFYFSL